MDNTKTRSPILPLILCAVFAILARTAGIVYSFLATDVLYSGSLVCLMMPYARQVLSAISFAFAAGDAVLRKHAGASIKLPVLVYAAVLIADGVAVILYDGLSGVLEGRLFFGILYRFWLAVYSEAVLFVGIGVAYLMLKRKIGVTAAAAAAAVIPVAVDLVTVIWGCVTSLIEWEFLPLVSEIHSMAADVGTVLAAGVLSAAAAWIAVRIHGK